MLQLDQLKIAIIGLGYVGLPLAVEFGKHITTLGFDINPQRINDLKKCIDHTLEVSSQELSEIKHLQYSDQVTDLVESNFYIVTVPTPIDDFKQTDLSQLINSS